MKRLKLRPWIDARLSINHLRVYNYENITTNTEMDSILVCEF